mmetsp:Transcript_48355/g.105421  ORF Transcript_48355/g.105421 Transcript_48355/m.105421 type:complete len:202 (+) Transcript_48355:207-812(+)
MSWPIGYSRSCSGGAAKKPASSGVVAWCAGCRGALLRRDCCKSLAAASRTACSFSAESTGPVCAFGEGCSCRGSSLADTEIFRGEHCQRGLSDGTHKNRSQLRCRDASSHPSSILGVAFNSGYVLRIIAACPAATAHLGGLCGSSLQTAKGRAKGALAFEPHRQRCCVERYLGSPSDLFPRGRPGCTSYTGWKTATSRDPA